MTFSRYRYLCEYEEDSPRSDEILAAVYLKPKQRYKRSGTGIEALARMFNLQNPGQQVSV